MQQELAEVAASLRTAVEKIEKLANPKPEPPKVKPKPGPTVESLYGDSLVNLKAPDGFEFTGEFRCVNDGEMVLGSNSFSRPCGALRWQSVGDVPRLILVPIPKPKRMVFEVVDGPYATTGMYNGYSICWNGKYLRFLREE